MKRILITGASGNVGLALIRFLLGRKTDFKIVAGLRNVEKSKTVFASFDTLEYVLFDFENPDTYEKALDGIDRVFLLRPPHIADTDKYFRPFVETMKRKMVNEVVFLSVQGVEKSKIIPHHKIEALIRASALNFIFIRPSYFMQNLTTTLFKDISEKAQIILPAGKAKFNWVDIENIGEVAAILLENFEAHQNQGYDLTGSENLNFQSVSELISKITNRKIEYRDTHPLKFFFIKKKEAMPKAMILVMIMLHYLPRFQAEPKISNFYKRLTQKQATTIAQFIRREAKNFL